ncbi:hypothetical protein BGZ97_012983 [Linnemannia gamsii]|jgi:hypothetical protein|uniref:Uncharacterized protein n=1 Tax=Linnemannia gamsii TaxID=64522 RepID=A0A9P6QZY4_9FUNG|nr:hypothetical protein BGZ97_012983 [Linnemannia gamsii]
MLKSVLMLALCAVISVAQAGEIHLWNSAGKRISLFDQPGRNCFCLENTKAVKMYNKDGINVKLFSTSDCTGNYAAFPQGRTLNNVHGINSVYIGQLGFPPSGPLTCPNYFA